MEKIENLQETEIKETTPLPFILNFLQYRKGATSFTTTGTYNDPDGADTD